MMSNMDIFLYWVCPSLGTIMANAMFAAPMHSLKDAISRGSLGDLNPTPWAFMTGNCLGWVAYSVATQNIFVLISNAPGLILSVWLNMGAAKLQYQDIFRANQILYADDDGLQLQTSGGGESNNNEDENAQDDDGGSRYIRAGGAGTGTSNTPSSPSYTPMHTMPAFTPHEHWVMRIVIVWMIVMSIACFAPMTNTEQANFIGLVVNINLIVFYGAPLSTIATVLRTRDSVSIHRRTLAMGCLNSSFWMGYGIGLMDMVIFMPNAAGFLLSVIQIILCAIFPKSEIEVVQGGGDVLPSNVEML